MDSGHPPLFGFLVAATWKIFGKNLIVSHFMMIPFLILNLLLALKIGEYFTPNQPWMFLLFMFVCPFYLGHSILVSPDVLLVSGFLLCLYAIIESKQLLAYLGAALLCLISMRGCMMGLAFLLFILIRNRKDIRAHLHMILPFVFGISLFFLYQLLHYLQNEWIGFHSDSPWEESFSIPGLKGIITNMILFAWRCLDYGLFILFFAFASRIYIGKRPNSSLFLLLVIVTTILFVVTVPFKGLMNHRYFLPVVLLFLLMFTQMVQFKIKWIPYVFAILLFAGNFIIYPKQIAQGWDSTLAHVPFYSLEQEMHVYINKAGINTEELGTAFPLKKERKYLDLNATHLEYQEYDLRRHKYILYSNIMNSFSDFELESLFNNWSKKKQLSRGRIEMILFEKK